MNCNTPFVNIQCGKNHDSFVIHIDNSEKLVSLRHLLTNKSALISTNWLMYDPHTNSVFLKHEFFYLVHLNLDQLGYYKSCNKL